METQHAGSLTGVYGSLPVGCIAGRGFGGGLGIPPASYPYRVRAEGSCKECSLKSRICVT